MRKPIFAFLVLAFLLQSCSAFAPASPTPTSSPTLTLIPTLTPTETSTPTITPSPTIVKIPTVDYNSTPTPPGYLYASPTAFPWVSTTTPVPTATPESDGEGFEWVRASEAKFYFGACRGNHVRISALVTYPKDVLSVTLFVRLRRLTAELFTPWSQGLGMEPTSIEGVWAQNLYGASIDGHQLFRRGWVWYQLVAIGPNGLEVARSRIFKDTLKLEPCMCMTPPCGP